MNTYHVMTDDTDGDFWVEAQFAHEAVAFVERTFARKVTSWRIAGMTPAHATIHRVADAPEIKPVR